MNDSEKAGLKAEYVGKMDIEIKKLFKELGYPDEYMEKWRTLLTHHIRHNLFPFPHGKVETELGLFF